MKPEKIMQIYLDSSATTAPRPEVVELVQKIMKDSWGNPSSLHFWGERAALILEKARFSVASLLNADSPDTIIFTSGGTEADNLAVFGTAYNYSQPQHIIISSVEHSAIASPVAMLEKQGWRVTRLPVDRGGRVNPDDLRESLRDDTVLVSIVYGQSEVGTIQPIEELVQITKTYSKALFHTDAVQVMGRLAVDVSALAVDLLSLSGHKFYGMQGAGALYIKKGVMLQPFMGGGGQEFGLRSGTQAIGAIAALGLASDFAQRELETESIRLRELRDYFIDLVLQECPYLQLTGHRYHRLPHHASFVINHPQRAMTGREMVRQLNFAGIGISAGSACSSGTSLPSPTLLAMGFSQEEAVRGIRFSCDRTTTKEDLDWVVMVLRQFL